MACEGLDRSPFIPGDPPAQPGGGEKQGYHSPLLRQQNGVPAAAPWHPCLWGCSAQPAPWVSPAARAPSKALSAGPWLQGLF